MPRILRTPEETKPVEPKLIIGGVKVGGAPDPDPWIAQTGYQFVRGPIYAVSGNALHYDSGFNPSGLLMAAVTGGPPPLVMAADTVPPPRSVFHAPIPATPAPKIEVISPRPLFTKPTMRRRIDLTPDDLRKVDPKASETVIAAAFQLALTTNLDSLRDEDILMWGGDFQAAHTRLLESMMTLSRHPALEESKHLIGTIIAGLEELDPSTFLAPTQGASLFRRILGGFTQARAKATFDEKYAELHRHISTLEAQLSKLAKVQDLFKGLADDFKALETRVAVSGLVCTYLADRSPADNLFANRAPSLLLTKVTIGSNLSQLAMFTGFIGNLSTCVRDILRTELPAWYSSYLSVFTLQFSAGRPDLSTLARQQSALVERLKSTANPVSP